MNDEQGRPARSGQVQRLVRQLLPCPFCGGPPKPIAMRLLHPYGAFPDSELDSEDGLQVRAVVFCHECGAEGQDEDGTCFEPSDVDALLAVACDQWNRRDQRHADLYESSAADGLNCWPRPNA